MLKRIKISWIKKAAGIAGLFALTLSSTAHGQQAAQESRAVGDLVVMASGFKSGEGQFILNVFATEAGYPLDTSRALHTLTGKVTHETMEIGLEAIAFGTYAVTILHDEDSNGKMTTGFLGMPKEAIGISNNPRSYFGAPDYEDAVFQLKESRKQITINLHSH